MPATDPPLAVWDGSLRTPDPDTMSGRIRETHRIPLAPQVWIASEAPGRCSSHRRWDPRDPLWAAVGDLAEQR